MQANNMYKILLVSKGIPIFPCLTARTLCTLPGWQGGWRWFVRVAFSPKAILSAGLESHQRRTGQQQSLILCIILHCWVYYSEMVLREIGSTFSPRLNDSWGVRCHIYHRAKKEATQCKQVILQPFWNGLLIWAVLYLSLSTCLCLWKLQPLIMHFKVNENSKLPLKKKSLKLFFF